MFERARERATYKESSIISFAESMQDRTASKLLGNKVVYHERDVTLPLLTLTNFTAQENAIYHRLKLVNAM